MLAVGRPGPLLLDAIIEYERRAARYWSFQVSEAADDDALLARTPQGFESVALTRTGESWSSRKLSEYLQQLAVQARPGVAFLIGGAFGLGAAVLERASRQLSLSPMTLPHDLARLFLAEQLYRAGTIMRNEPYHKARG